MQPSDIAFIKKGVKPGIILWSFICATLVFLLFLPASSNRFVMLDDLDYITANPHDGLTWEALAWCFSLVTDFHWHPLTMLLFTVEREFFGMNPAPYHMVNILIHSASVFLVCILFHALLIRAFNENGENGASSLRTLTAAVLSALFFGAHPLRAESVVWVTELKDVLALFFMTGSLLAYLRFTTGETCRTPAPFRVFPQYASALALFVLALLSKPTAITLPLLLLLLDWYPLRRLTGRASWMRCVLEKIPFLLLSLFSSAMTLLAQKQLISESSHLSLLSRILVAARALLLYLAKTIWPADLCVFYYHPGDVAATAPLPYAAGLLLVIAITAAVCACSRRCPFLPAHWLFFVISLLPALGIVQAGEQYAANRFTYLPSLSLSLLWGGVSAWLIFRYSGKGISLAAAALVAGAALQLTAYAWLTTKEIGYWYDTESLATRIIDLTPPTSTKPYYFRAESRLEKGKLEPALADLDTALSIYARKPESQDNRPQFLTAKSFVLYRLGRHREALEYAEYALRISRNPLPEDFMLMYEELRNKRP